MSMFQPGNSDKNPMRWFIVLFGLFWTGIALFIVTVAFDTAGMFTWPILIFPIFGIFFVASAFKAATKSKNRSQRTGEYFRPEEKPIPEEEDPFAKFDEKVRKAEETVLFCPQCGSHVDLTDAYCAKCGTRIR